MNNSRPAMSNAMNMSPAVLGIPRVSHARKPA
jgi:hypothetical protein